MSKAPEVEFRSIFVCGGDSSLVAARDQLTAITNLEGVTMFQARKIVSAVVMVLGACLPLAAQQAGGTKVGVLSCRTSASLGLIVGSHQKLRCSFRPDNGPSENYVGHINRLGLDLGVKAGGVMAWGVFAPTAGLHHGALAGKYVGGSGSASLGVGVGANALIGGSHRSIALQPLSVEGQVGVNLALGVAGLSLSPGP